MSRTIISNYQFETGLKNDFRDDFSPEELMWRTVVLVFLQDIQKDYLTYTTSLNGKRGKAFDKLKTHQNIANSEWLQLVCEFARIDYNCFLDVIDKVLKGEMEVTINAQYVP